MQKKLERNFVEIFKDWRFFWKMGQFKVRHFEFLNFVVKFEVRVLQNTHIMLLELFLFIFIQTAKTAKFPTPRKGSKWYKIKMNPTV